MKSNNKMLIIRQLDKKLQTMQPLLNTPVPSKGWINLIREALNMSLRHLGSRLKITPQGMKDIETREIEGTITMKALKEAGDAVGMRLVYGFVPKGDTLEKMIERKAAEKAQKIVRRTSTTMKLEDQENSNERIKQAIADLTDELKREMPKNLWD